MPVGEIMDDSEQNAWEATPVAVVLTIEEQARQFYSARRLGRARQHYEKLVKMRPEVSQYWMMLGVIYRRQNRLVKALTCLQRAVDLDSGSRNALLNLGECLVLAGKLEEGVDILRAVFEMGFVDGKSAEEQDQMTKRAGAQLAMLREIARSVRAQISGR